MKTVSSLFLVGLAGQAVAFPAIAQEAAESLARNAKRQAIPGLPGGFTAPSLIPPGFNEKAQYIDTTGKYAWQAPRKGDQRGMCPGLNALSNHGYLPRNGVASIAQYIEATNKVYGMGIDLSTFLAVYGAVFDGDLTGWSMGGETNQGLPLGFLTKPRGLDGSHNKYDADSSPTRGDLYLYGDATHARVDQWDQMYALQSNVSNDAADYNLEVLTPFRYERVLDSRKKNPYFFNAPFSGIAVQPAAYTFIWRFMANHSQEYPEGRLDQENLKSFFAFSGEPGNWKYNVGQERIPDNWYRRAVGDEYTIPFFVEDVVLAAKSYPAFLQVGGNLGKPDSFVGVDPLELTKGVLNTAQLLEGNNLFCFALEIAVQQAPDLLFGVVTSVGNAVGMLNTAVGNAIKGLGCPQLAGVNTGSLNQFPGYTKLKKDGTY